MKIYKYYNDTYPVALHLAVYDRKEDIKNVQNDLCKMYKTDLKIDLDRAAVTYGVLYDENKTFTVLIVYLGKDMLNIKNMFHEGYHALDFYIAYMSLDNESQFNISNEHLAYLSGWIGEQHKNFIDELKKNKKKSKK